MAVEHAPIAELIDVIRPGGLATQKAPRIQATLRTIREERGDHSLEFLGEMPALEARAWLTAIDGIGKKTASVLLLFCFGLPLMPVDRHVERVTHRVGLLPPKAIADLAHDFALALLAPERSYEAHVNLIHHGRASATRGPGPRAVPAPRPLPLRGPEGPVDGIARPGHTAAAYKAAQARVTHARSRA